MSIIKQNSEKRKIGAMLSILNMMLSFVLAFIKYAFSFICKLNKFLNEARSLLGQDFALLKFDS